MSQPAPRSLNRNLTLLAACLGFVVVILDVSVVNVATNALSEDFGESLSGLQWVINGYTLTFAAFLLSAGALGDRFDSTRIFQVGFALFAITSLACGASPTLLVLVVSRMVQGLAAALIVPASLTIVNNTFPDKIARTKAVSLWAAAGGLALAAGPVVGGLLIEQFGWQSIFFMNLPIALAGIWLAQANAPRVAGRSTSPVRRSIDIPGQVLAVVGLGALTAGIIEANSLGWFSPLVITCLAVFLLSLVAFIIIEQRHHDPMLPLKLFGRKAFTSTSLIGVLLNFAFYGLIFTFSLFFQKGWGYSPIDAGLALLPMTAAIMLANLACGPLTKKFGARTVMIGGNTLATLGFLALVPVAHTNSYLAFLAQFLIAGFGIGLVVPAMTNAMLSAVDKSNAGIAAGVLNASRQLGGLLGVAILGLFIGGSSASSFVSGLQPAVILAAVAFAISALLSTFGIPRQAGTAETLIREADPARTAINAPSPVIPDRART